MWCWAEGEDEEEACGWWVGDWGMLDEGEEVALLAFDWTIAGV